jgi:hypothetical protein
VKLSKKERTLLNHQIQLGFIQTWLSQSRARKEKQSELKKVKSGGSHWFAFWKRPLRFPKAVPPIIVAKAAGSEK